MAEILVGAAATAATGGAAAVPATAGLIGAGGAVTAGGLLTAASAGFSVLSGLRTASALRGQASIADYNARQQTVQGLAEGNRVREAMLRTLAAQNAAFGARGFDLNSGTPVTLADEATAAGRRQIDTATDNAAIVGGQQRLTAQALRSQATGAAVGGVVRGGFSLLDRLG